MNLKDCPSNNAATPLEAPHPGPEPGTRVRTNPRQPPNPASSAARGYARPTDRDLSSGRARGYARPTQPRVIGSRRIAPRPSAITLASSLLLAATAGSAAAESSDAATPTAELKKLSLAELMEIQVDTVYGASKHEQTTAEAPSSVSIVSRDDIKKYGHRTLADILNSARGLYVTYDRGYSYIGARGFNRPGDYGGRMLLMIDGHRLNDGIYDTAASGTDFPLDVDLIERVEIIRGPGSSLYGNNAFFGVINVITRRGRDLDGAELSGSYGSFDTWTGRASYGQRLTNGVEFALSGSLYDSVGQKRLDYPEFTAEKLDGGWTRQGFASVSYRDFSLQGGFMRRSKDWPTAAYDTQPNAQDPRLTTADERAYVDLTFRHEFENEWLVAARGYFDHYRYEADYPYDYDDDPSTRPDLNRDYALATSAGLDFSLSKQLWNRHRLTVGGEWRHDFELTQENWDEDPRVEYTNAREQGDIFSLFAQDEWSIRTNLLLNAGLRYDYYSAFGNTINPRAALIYSPWEPTTFKFLYGQAFRAPNAYESYYDGAGSQANPDLDPETIRSYELVWEQRFGRRWRTTVSAFWNDVNDLINQTQIDVDNDPTTLDDDVYVFENTGSARARGMEFEVETKLPCGFTAGASYTFTDTKDDLTGDKLNNSPQHLGKVRLNAPLWREKVFAGLEVQAMSDRTTVGGYTAPAHAIANFTLFSRELVKGLELSASVYNLFDKRYTHPVSGDFTYTGPISGEETALDQVEQDGRTFRVKLTYRF